MASKPAPQERTMKLTEVKQQFSRVINEVARGESYVVVEKNGTESAIIVEPGEFRHYQRMKREQQEKRERFFEKLALLGEEFEGVPEEELEREFARARAEVRDEMALKRLERNLTDFSAAFRDVPYEEFEKALAESRREYRANTDRKHGPG